MPFNLKPQELFPSLGENSLLQKKSTGQCKGPYSATARLHNYSDLFKLFYLHACSCAWIQVSVHHGAHVQIGEELSGVHFLFLTHL